MKQTLLVINPNRTQVVTDHISLALEPFRRPDGPAIVCETADQRPARHRNAGACR